jgi:hypothetical protein
MLEPAVIANEFAAVSLEVVRQGRGAPLMLRELESGATVSLRRRSLMTVRRRWAT